MIKKKDRNIVPNLWIVKYDLPEKQINRSPFDLYKEELQSTISFENHFIFEGFLIEILNRGFLNITYIGMLETTRKDDVL